MRTKNVNGFRIQSGVPLPRARRRRSGGRYYPWRDMQIGDSVFIPCENGESPERVVMRLGASLAYAAPLKFTRRREDNGVRVWRIE